MVITHGAVSKLPQLQLHSATVAPVQLISLCPEDFACLGTKKKKKWKREREGAAGRV